MLVHVPGVLTLEDLREFRSELEAVQWLDGRGSAGYLSQRVKRNQQLPDNHPLARKLGERILRALADNPLFTAAALPLRILPPLFNRYDNSETYGRHVDGAIRPLSGTPLRVRTDLSATLFLCDPDSYEGGELEVEDTYGPRQVKLPAGDLVLYPGTSVHRVLPVTKGTRLASFFWIQSMVRDDGQRTLLFDLDTAIQRLTLDLPDHPAAVQLTAVYHNLLRRWAEA